MATATHEIEPSDPQTEEREAVVVRFAGDSGDGMQLTGGQFTLSTALAGNDLSTFPDFPAEIRAPQGTTFGVSAFQINFGSAAIETAGDQPDVLVAMNPAALKVNIESLREGGLVIADTGEFTARNLAKAGYESDPIEGDGLAKYKVLAFDISARTLEAVEPFGLNRKEALRCKNMWTLGLALWMAVWWVTEVVPLAATSLLPIAVLPVLGVASTRDAAAPYANELIFLFLAGFLLAAALERWRCHERIAYGIVGRVGSSPPRIILGVMLATAFISMWISNTATTAMMFPIVMAIGGLFDAGEAGGRARMALLLGMAYAATIGGMATLIGTPPNLILAGAARELIGVEIDFGKFMLVGLPITAVLLPVTWLLMVGLFRVTRAAGRDAGAVVADRARGLGRVRGGERIVFVVFALTALGWFFREPKALGLVTLPGLTQLAPALTDAGVGVLAVILLFTLRGRTPDGAVRPLLTWTEARGIPWDVLLLFGGGLSLAGAMDASGLTGWIAGTLEGLRAFPLPLIFLGLAFVIVGLGEFASNVAMAAVMMPLVVSLAAALGQPPILLMLVAGLTASLGFALPVATPPNAIVFGSGQIPMKQMVRAGLVLDVVAILITVALLSILAPAIFG